MKAAESASEAAISEAVRSMVDFSQLRTRALAARRPRGKPVDQG
jgi:hypothetical protein